MLSVLGLNLKYLFIYLEEIQENKQTPSAPLCRADLTQPVT